MSRTRIHTHLDGDAAFKSDMLPSGTGTVDMEWNGRIEHVLFFDRQDTVLLLANALLSLAVAMGSDVTPTPSPADFTD